MTPGIRPPVPGSVLPPMLRLFVAAYPTIEVARELARIVGSADLPPCRMTVPEQIHLTLLFIGDTERTRLNDVIESVERSTAGVGPFMLTPMRLIVLPDRGRTPPRLVAAETDSPPGMLEIQRRLASRLARTARGRAGDRFRPHLTLCRFVPGGPAGRVGGLGSIGHVPAFEVSHVSLMHSTLGPGGARHAEVARAVLG